MHWAVVRKGLGMLPAIGGVVVVEVGCEGGAAWVEVVGSGASVARERICWVARKFVKRCFAGMRARLDAMF